MKRLFVLVVVAVIGCDGAHRDHGDDTDGGIDPPVTCGSVTCDQIPAATCDGNTLREHTAACTDATCGYPVTETECGPAGCCGDHCCEVAVSNAGETGTLMPTGLTVSPPNGTFDTDTECVAPSALGQCTVVARGDLPEACVCRMDTLVIGTLEIKGARALVILAYETVRIDTTLDLSGDLGAAGPGARGVVYTTSAYNEGGSGGTFATKGAAGGHGATSDAVYGDATLIPLLGGMNGMHGGVDNSGGGGGGAVQISAGVRIEIPGNIFVGGGGGLGGRFQWATAGGGGGGSGGSILLEAPSIMMTGRLDANGGGGGGAGGDDYYGNNGEDANDDMPSGGACPDSGSGCIASGYVYGGHGGSGATGSSSAVTGSSGGSRSGCLTAVFIGGGGGGGGLGRIRINTKTGCQCSGTVSPAPSFGMLGVQ
ncbi:MAG TPA: hypothetical protein VIV11_33495 [Kofleriaceae bacterium]